MAIYLYYGKIGDGKTYHVLANEVVPAARKGRKIYTNLDGLNVRRLSQYVDREVDVIQWESVDQIRAAFNLAQDDKEGASLVVDRGALLIVDEAQMIFDSRQWKDTGPGVLRLCEYHRHFGLDIVFITQSPGRLDKSLCRLANESLHVKNLRFLGSMFGKRYVINVRQTPWDRETMATMTGSFKPEIFALYRSSVVNARARVSKSAVKITWLVAPAGIALALLFFTRNGGFGFTKVARMQPVSGSVVAASVPSADSPRLAASLVDSPSMRVHAGAVSMSENMDIVEDVEERKPSASLIGRIEQDGVTTLYILRVGNRVVRVLAPALVDYDIDGAL
jgi:hypothetical protein